MDGVTSRSGSAARRALLGSALAMVILAGSSARTSQEVLTLQGDVAPVHDPVVIKEKDTYYVFCTGGRNGQGVIPIRTSTDLRTWKAAGFTPSPRSEAGTPRSD